MRRLERHNHTDAQVAAVSAPQGAAWEGTQACASVRECPLRSAEASIEPAPVGGGLALNRARPEDPVMAGMLYDNKAAAQLEQAYATTDMIVQREELRRSLGASAGESILDLGSGPAFLTCELAQEVGATGRIVAVDISPDMNSIAAKRITAAGSATGSTFWRATRQRLRLQTRSSTPLSRHRSLSTSPTRTPRSSN